MQQLTAAKNGRYVGAGDPLDMLIAGKSMGEHFFPANPVAQYKHWYGFQESCRFNSNEYTVHNPNSGAAGIGAGGLVLTTGSVATTDDVQLVHARTFTPAAGKRAIAFCRLQISDIANPGFVFGWSNTVTDWFNAEATHSAAFLMAKGGATVVGRSKDGTTGSSTATLFTAVAATDYDVYVLLDGTTGIEFGIKLATATTFAKTRKTTNLPTAALSLIMNIENGTAAAKSLTLARWGFWAEHTNVL